MRGISDWRRAGSAISVLAVIGMLLGFSGCGGRRAGNPTSNALTASGLDAYFEGDLQSAERLLRSAVNHNHGDTLARYYLARAYMARGTPDGRMAAESVLTDLVEASDDQPRYLDALARLRLRQGYRSNARRTLDRLIEVAPDDPNALFQLGRLYEGDYWRFLDRADRLRAMNYYDRALQRDPGHEPSLVRMATISLEEDRVQDAGLIIEQLMEYHPDDVRTRMMVGVLAEYRGEFQTAETLFRDAIADYPVYEQEAFFEPYYLEPDSSDLFWNSVAEAVPGIDVNGEGPFIDDEERALRFWAERDPTPGTRANERFAVHASRMTMADLLYGDPRTGTRGWDTPPGEFYIRYGKPRKRWYRLQGQQPTWYHLYDVGGRQAMTLRFVDYNLQGKFMLPIESGYLPAHVRLRYMRPENDQLQKRVTAIELPYSTAWFRTLDGEPRLQVAVATMVADEPRVCETAVLDSTWSEIYHAAQLVEPDEIPPSWPVAQSGLFLVDLYPGEHAAHLRGTVGKNGQLAGDLGQPVPREGFAMSDIVLGFQGDSGFMPNPGFPYPVGVPVGVQFEVYGIQTDLAGSGYLAITLSVVPEQSSRGVIARLFQGAGTPSFVTSLLDETVSGERWQRYLEIDTAELPPGSYQVRVEITDTLTQETVTRQRVLDIIR